MFGNRSGFLSLHAVLGIWKHGVGRVEGCRAAQSEHAGAAAAAAIQCAVTLQFPLSPCKGASLTHPHEYSSTVKPVNANSQLLYTHRASKALKFIFKPKSCTAHNKHSF